MLSRQQKKALSKAAIASAIVVAAVAYSLLATDEMPHKVHLPLVVNHAVVPVRVAEKGIANTTNQCDDAYKVGASWHYNWGPSPPICPGVDGVPMFGCKRHIDELRIDELRSSAWVASSSPYVLGFNEPDLDTDPLTPEQAAVLWRELERHFPGKRLISPAPSHLHPEWLEEFYSAFCTRYGRPPYLYGLAIHCYLFDAAECKAVIEQVVSYADKWGVPSVWVTEFAIRDQAGMSKAQALAESRELINWMQAHPKITHYAWFPSGTLGGEWWAGFGTYLVDRTVTPAALTDWGAMYAASPTEQ